MLGSQAGRIYVFTRDAGVYSLIQNLTIGAGLVTGVSLAKDKSAFVAGFGNKSVIIFSLVGTTYTSQQTLLESPSAIEDVVMSVDKTTIISGASNG